VDRSRTTPGPSRVTRIGGLIRRWGEYTFIVVALFVLTMSLRAISEPLATTVPILAAVLLVYLLYRGLTGRW
jgi:hypothetical protein